MQKHYVIGDIHGEYKTLLALVAKLPKDAKLIFVGDIVDRGLQSREIVQFIRKHKYQMVLGNHESLFIHYGQQLIECLLGTQLLIDMDKKVTNSGRAESFASYGLMTIDKCDSFEFHKNNEGIEKLKDDLEWMKKLPLYIKLDALHSSGKPVIISHSNISKVWNIRDEKENRKKFVQITLWTREFELDEEAKIFNIFGHCPQEFEPEITENYVNIDTGCCFFDFER
jgi:serine/threonine protein phosphatase 1